MFQKKPITPIQGHGTETVVVTATVRTRSAASASAASAAVTKLLEDSSKTTDTFRMPVKSVQQPPTVVSEAPHPFPLSRHSTDGRQPLNASSADGIGAAARYRRSAHD